MAPVDHIARAKALFAENPDLFEVTVFGMVSDCDGGHASDGEEPEFYDILLRPTTEAFWRGGSKDPIIEHENLSLEKASEIVGQIEAEWPEIAVEWVQ